MDYIEMTAPCGLDCFNCPLYEASYNEETRADLARKFGLSVEKAQCRGCRAEEGRISFLNMAAPCGVYTCVEGKRLHLCCDCGDFPCDRLQPYADKAGERPHNLKIYNLCLIRKLGIDEWARTRSRAVRRKYFMGALTLS